MGDRVRVGLFADALEPTDGDPERLRATLGRVADASVDHLCVGDHVSFFVGAGSDGLITATSLLAVQAALPVYVGAVPAAVAPPGRRWPASSRRSRSSRRVGSRSASGSAARTATRSRSAGSTRRTRGRRMDECLHILRRLAGGTPVTFAGEFFALDDALILPAPSPSIPLIVGGRSDAAVGRAATLGDGWLGIWVSARRYGAVRDHIAGAGSRGRAGSEPVRARAQRLVRLRGHPRRCPRAARDADAGASTRCRSSRSSATRPTGRPTTSRSSCVPTSTPVARPST